MHYLINELITVGVMVFYVHSHVATKVEHEVEFRQSTQLLYRSTFHCLLVALFVAVKDLLVINDLSFESYIQ